MAALGGEHFDSTEPIKRLEKERIVQVMFKDERE
jgi:hypothetical protein